MTKALGDILANLDAYSWNEWVYICRAERKNLNTACIVLNPDEAELGEDGFTPLFVEKLSMEEFLSIQDLRSVRDNLFCQNPIAEIKELCDAALYYYECDSFISLN